MVAQAGKFLLESKPLYTDFLDGDELERGSWTKHKAPLDCDKLFLPFLEAGESFPKRV